MKTFHFILYGAWVGALSASVSALAFGVLTVLSLLWAGGVLWGDVRSALLTLKDAALYASLFAVIPGAIGGAYLAAWLGASARTPRQTTWHGLLAGALAGLSSAIAFIRLVLLGMADRMTVLFAALAILIAAAVGLFAAKFLERKKTKS